MSAEAAGIDDCIVDGKGAGVSLNWSLIGGDLYAVDYASIVGASISVVCCLIIMGACRMLCVWLYDNGHP